MNIYSFHERSARLWEKSAAPAVGKRFCECRGLNCNSFPLTLYGIVRCWPSLMFIVYSICFFIAPVHLTGQWQILMHRWDLCGTGLAEGNQTIVLSAVQMASHSSRCGYAICGKETRKFPLAFMPAVLLKVLSRQNLRICRLQNVCWKPINKRSDTEEKRWAETEIFGRS